MIVEVTIPSPGESVTDVQLVQWLCEDGDIVGPDEDIAEVDSDKATLTLPAPDGGRITLLVQAGERASVGSVIATIDTDYAEEGDAKKTSAKKTAEKKMPVREALKATPLARRVIEVEELDEEELKHKLGHKKIHRSDLTAPAPEMTKRVPMSSLRRRVAERLVSVKNETAMLTTFNEVNMEAVQVLRAKYGDAFKDKYGVPMGLMSFFTFAACRALEEFPGVNARIDGDDIVYHHYTDIGIAVSTPKGLMVPVVRGAHAMNAAQLEQAIRAMADKARDNRIAPDDLSGGTFSITNGGVFGSMLSTPILNPPQSGILGMHNIIERPVAVDGKVVIKPMMYLAFSYDHRVIDGRESVGFLKKVKEIIEDPAPMNIPNLM